MVEHGRLLARLIPGARLCVLEGVGHTFWHEDTERVSREIRSFLATPAAAL